MYIMVHVIIEELYTFRWTNNRNNSINITLTIGVSRSGISLGGNENLSNSTPQIATEGMSFRSSFSTSSGEI